MTNVLRGHSQPWINGFERDLRDLRERVSAEFTEMPGLRLTVAQAARLFSVDREQCRGVLDSLVSEGVLSTDGTVFQMAGAGRRHV